MKFESNWKMKSLDSLEKVNWGNQDYDSPLVKTVHKLRTLPLNEYRIEDLRIMIGQNIGLNFLIPLAIEQLNVNLFAEGDYYEGDLLQVVLSSNKEYWINHKDNWLTIIELINECLDELDSNKIKYSDFLNIFKSH